MNNSLDEQVSALLDGELRRQESGLLLRRLRDSLELAARLGRYSLIGEAMRQTLPPAVDPRLADRVAARVQAEPALPRRRLNPLRQPVLRPVAGFAVAASVAATAIFVWPATQVPAPAGGDTEFAVTAAPGGAVEPAASEESRHWERLDPEVQQRLNGYLVNHSEHTPTGRFGGMLNYVRITSQQDDE